MSWTPASALPGVLPLACSEVCAGEERWWLQRLPGSPCPGREQGTIVHLVRAGGPGCDGSHTSSVSQGAAACTETQTPQLFAAICGLQSVARDSSYSIKAAIQGLRCASG